LAGLQVRSHELILAPLPSAGGTGSKAIEYRY